mgnify:CR=1 FL=1
MIVQAVIFTRRLDRVYILPLETVIQKADRRLVMLMEKESRIVDGHFDLGLLPPGPRERVLAETGLGGDREWHPLEADRWDRLELAARHRLRAMVTDPGAHQLLGPGVRVRHRGAAARLLELRRSRIVGDRCIVPAQGTFSPGDLLIARGHYRVTDGREVRVARRNELGLPGEAGDR